MFVGNDEASEARFELRGEFRSLVRLSEKEGDGAAEGAHQFHAVEGSNERIPRTVQQVRRESIPPPTMRRIEPPTDAGEG